MSSTGNLIVIFDGDCGICQALRRRAERLDTGRRLTFAAYQRADLDALAPGLTRTQASKSLYAVREDGRRLRGARAFFAAMRRLPGVWGVVGRIGSLPPLVWIAEPVYRLVARYRGTISRWLGLTACAIEPPA